MNEIFYADSSVLVKLHVREIGSDWRKRLVEKPTKKKDHYGHL